MPKPRTPFKGRRQPYTPRGIKRIPCSHCRATPSHSQWQACANGGRWLALCWDCDVKLNQMALRFMGFSEPEVDDLLDAYTEREITTP